MNGPTSTSERDEALATRLRAIGVVPVVQLPDPSVALPLVDALTAGGIPCLEVTFRAAGAADAIAAIRRERPAMLVGAGTVLSVDQADTAVDAGAQFVVSPGTNPRIVERVLERGVPMIPGVATPSEIEANLERGLRLLKFFPAEALGGTGFLRGVRGPFADVGFVPSGGVTAANLADYLAEPNVVAVGGSWIASVTVLADKDFATIERAARDAVGIIRASRAETRTAT
jgi:2-dehydro-3-deoxyphosphogluconate aldolase / (4S)-4-hydroxy-2-oxoglutarate aldolase